LLRTPVRGRTWCPIDAEQRFTELYDANYRRVLAYARSRVGPQAAEELASETFLVVWARLDQVPGAVVPWLLGITRNLVRERRRAAGRQVELAAALDLTTRAVDLVAGDVADQVVERAAALRALASLSDADRETLTLVAWHGLASPGGGAGGRVQPDSVLGAAAPRAPAPGTSDRGGAGGGARPLPTGG
jgi:RNA polymerase sigma-70 factor, ECF subfamily